MYKIMSSNWRDDPPVGVGVTTFLKNGRFSGSVQDRPEIGGLKLVGPGFALGNWSPSAKALYSARLGPSEGRVQ